MPADSGQPGRWPIIAIDGPAGAGKTTTAREVAKRLGFLHLDTGAMYRAIALKVLRANCPLDQPREIARIATAAEVGLKHENGSQRVFLNGTDVTAELRTEEVTRAVTPVCEVPEVRERMVQLQRRLGEAGGVVVEGRDIGTIVFPQAQLKIFLTADLEERARRRATEIEATGGKADLQEVMREIERRDCRDQSRSHSPLKPAEDAIVLDTTHMAFHQQVETILRRIAAIHQ
jgi:cytidylate kinase